MGSFRPNVTDDCIFTITPSEQETRAARACPTNNPLKAHIKSDHGLAAARPYNGRMGVFTIPASAPFLSTLIGALRDGRLVGGLSSDPLALADTTLFLPTRRACALARAAFLKALKTEAAVLPRLVPLGDIDEDELAFADMANGAEALEIPDALGGLERRMLLAQLVLTWIASPSLRTGAGQPLVANSPASALALADALARLMDDMTTRQVEWSRLDDIVPREYDEYWKKSLEFLQIAREVWPAILAERDRIDPAARRDLLIEAERERLEKHSGPVIAAGSTGSMPATAKLLATIAGLPHGAVVLPGLDTDLDDETWTLIGGEEKEPPASGHPQFAMHALLRRIGIARADVTVLGESSARTRLVSEAMRPSMRTERWAQRIDEAARDTALANVAVIEAANAEDEALAIAVALREAVHEDKTAALVTPDRALARRVAAALGRWSIEADDSGGDALPDTEAGVFARLVAEAALGELPPVKLLAMLKHPRFRLGAAAGAHAKAVATLGACDPARPAPAPRHHGPRARAGHVPYGRAASFRSAQQTEGRRPRRRAGADRGARKGPRAARERKARAVLHRHRGAACRGLARVVARRCRRGDRVCGARRRGARERLRRNRRTARRFPHIGGRLSRPVRDRDRGAHLPPRRAAGRARADPRTARSAARQRRPRGARRAGRERVAAGDAQRSVAVAPDAARPRARPARTARRPFGARLRAIARRARGRSEPRREARRRADGRVALHAAPRGGRGRDTLGRCAAPRPEISRLGAQSRSRRQGQGHRATAPAAAARRASGAAQRHRDRALAARSLHDLRQAHPEASAARRRRYAARRARPRHRDPRRDRRVHRDLCQGSARRSARRAARARREAFRAAAGFSRGARVLVAALRAHRALVRRLGGAAARAMPARCMRKCGRRSTSRSTSASSG